MKHIFVVHSNITYLSALGIIDYHNLPVGDVMILSQSYKCESPIKVVPIKLFTLNIFRCRRFFNFAFVTDRLIADFCGADKFAVYMSAAMHLERIVMTNCRCVKINFMEEGIGSYNRQFELENHVYEDRQGSFRAHLSWSYIKEVVIGVANVIRGLTPKLRAIPMNYTSYVHLKDVDFYGFHAAVFPLSDKRIVLDMGSLSGRFDFPLVLNDVDLDGQYILVGEGSFSLFAQYSIDNYIDILRRAVLPKLQLKGVKRLYIKHHYNENIDSRQRSTALFTDNGIEVVTIAGSAIMEIELLKYKGATLIGCSSSLLFYGALMGLKCYSYFDYLGAERFEMDAYWDVIYSIDNL